MEDGSAQPERNLALCSHGSRIGTENLGAFPRTIIGDFTPKPDSRSISEIPREPESFTLEQHSLATAAFRLLLGTLFPISKMSNDFKGTGLSLTQQGGKGGENAAAGIPTANAQGSPIAVPTPTPVSCSGPHFCFPALR